MNACKRGTVWCELVLASMIGWLTATGASAQNSAAQPAPPPTPYQVIERGANHRVWQQTTYETLPDGSTAPHLHKYTELASGLEYWQNGQWIDSVEQIEASAQGAVAQQGQYQVIFANNLNSAGAIDHQTPDGKRLRSNVLGLAYYDASSEQSVMIGQIQDSQGELISANQVLYANAFTGVQADVRYTYKLGSFEQDIILRAQPPSPASLGLNPATTEIEVLTEFLDPPAAALVEHPSQFRSLPDEDVIWGATRLGHGKAFDLDETDNSAHRINVRRQYLNLSGRTILVEGVPLQKIQPGLSALPLQSSRQTKLPVYAAKTPPLPKTPLAKAQTKPMKMAAAAASTKGYVLDYVTINGETNYTFQGDTTYYVSGNYTLFGITTIEGGTVIKMNGYGTINIYSSGALACNTAAYRPAVFTSLNDNTVGQAISGSTGTPGLDVNQFLDLYQTNVVLNGLRFSYCCVGITMNWGFETSWLNIWDSQFKNVDVAIYGWNVGLHNVLMGNSGLDYDSAVLVEGTNLTGENVTAATGYGLVEADYPAGPTTVALTNCLITSQPLIGSAADTIIYATNTTACLPSPVSPVYQAVGGGNYYLTNNSPWHNAGTTNISPGLLVDLAGKTTYPPLVYSNVTISLPTTFNLQAPRDELGNPDLGYHYDPLDYVFGGVTADSNLTFTAGCAVGWFNGGLGDGISLQGTAQASFQGTATAPCVLARNDMVQEGGNGIWTAGSYLGGFTGQGGNNTPATAPTLNFQFTHCFTRDFEGPFFRDYGDGTLLVTTANNSEFYSGSAAGYAMYFDLTNCLCFRTVLGVNCTCPASISTRNCTFIGGQLAGYRSGATWPVMVENCTFATTDFSYLDNASAGNTNVTWINFNSYLTGDALPAGQGSHYLTVTSYNWETSWFGNYYLPPSSTLINAGSTTANLVGLYHFTTQTNQVPETNSVVDIGYHYVAAGSNGQPLSTPGDGVPDYLADANGNGLVDAGELSWTNYVSINGLVSGKGLVVYTPLK